MAEEVRKIQTNKNFHRLSDQKQAISNKEKFGPDTGQVAWWQPAIVMFLRLSGWIAGPVIIALFLGKWLDKKYDSAPWLFLACTFLAFVISMLGLAKNALAEYKKIEILSKKAKRAESEPNQIKK